MQVSVTHELQSQAREDVIELQVTRDGKEALEMLIEYINMDTQEKKQWLDKFEKKMKEVFTKIPKSVQEAMRSGEEQIQIIVQILEDYKKEIEDLNENLTPTTPLEVTTEREQ